MTDEVFDDMREAAKEVTDRLTTVIAETYGVEAAIARSAVRSAALEIA
jgi:hypothetical protein